MAAKVVMKLGGGLITDKSSFKTAKKGVIDSICSEISKIIANGHSVILIHGAGSFGHLLAKKWSLAGGIDDEISEQQRDAVLKVRSDMAELCEYVTDSLSSFGVEFAVFHLQSGLWKQERASLVTWISSIIHLETPFQYPLEMLSGSAERQSLAYFREMI